MQQIGLVVFDPVITSPGLRQHQFGEYQCPGLGGLPEHFGGISGLRGIRDSPRTAASEIAPLRSFRPTHSI